MNNVKISLLLLFFSALNGCLFISECPLQANSAALGQWWYFQFNESVVHVSRSFIHCIHSLRHIQIEGQ